MTLCCNTRSGKNEIYSSDSALKHHLGTGLRRMKILLLRPNMLTETPINDLAEKKFVSLPACRWCKNR